MTSQRFIRLYSLQTQIFPILHGYSEYDAPANIGNTGEYSDSGRQVFEPMMLSSCL